MSYFLTPKLLFFVALSEPPCNPPFACSKPGIRQKIQPCAGGSRLNPAKGATTSYAVRDTTRRRVGECVNIFFIRETQTLQMLKKLSCRSVVFKNYCI